MEINTHGRNINQETLANASNATKGLGSRAGEYVEIFYDKSTGDVWCKYHWDREEWTVYHVADMIASTLTQEARWELENAAYPAGGTRS